MAPLSSEQVAAFPRNFQAERNSRAAVSINIGANQGLEGDVPAFDAVGPPPQEEPAGEAIPELPDRGMEISYDESEEADPSGIDEILVPRRVIDRHAGYHYYS
jgi:hypothetical protein